MTTALKRLLYLSLGCSERLCLMRDFGILTQSSSIRFAWNGQERINAQLTPVPTNPIPDPPNSGRATPESVATGALIPAIERIKSFSPDEWELFVLEWVHSLKQTYSNVEHFGGSGDKGVDVIAFPDDVGDIWDNYQCKHYNHRLRPSDIWLEIGKVVLYSFRTVYSWPRGYYFVAPLGVNTVVSNLLRNHVKLKSSFIESWDQHCKSTIISNEVIELDETLSGYIAALDFSIFHAKSPLTMVDEHRRTPYHATRFGGGLPQRPEPEPAPEELQSHESIYITKLFQAYSDHTGNSLVGLSDIDSNIELKNHYSRTRNQFYSAEALRSFSKETLPPGEYNRLQDEIHEGISDVVDREHPDGYARLHAAVETAHQMQITDHPLVSRLGPRDRGGVCHQLANDDKVTWVK